MNMKWVLLALILLPLCLGLFLASQESREPDYVEARLAQYRSMNKYLNETRWVIKEPASVDHITRHEFMNYYASNGMVERVEYLLPMEKGYDFLPALSLAAQNNQLDVVILLIVSGLPSETDIRQATIDAAKAGHIDVFSYLLKQGGAFDLESIDYLLIKGAIKGGRLDVFKLCLEYYGVAWNELTYKTLREASKYGSIDIVKYLIEDGADVNDQMAVSLRAAAGEGHFEIVKLLVLAGADVHAGNNDALHRAVRESHLEMVQFLLDHGASPNGKSLLLAVRQENYELVEALIAAGGDFKVVEKPLRLANSVKNRKLKKLLLAQLPQFSKVDLYLKRGVKQGNDKKVKNALESGANVNVDNGWPLRLAAIDGNTSIVKLLLDHGANLRENNDQALRGAARRGHSQVVKLLLDYGPDSFVYSNEILAETAHLGHTETVKILLDYGADIHFEDDWPLVWAANVGQTPTVKLLLERGANPNSYGNYSRNALTMASENGSTDIVELLLLAGADVHADNNAALATALSNAYKYRRTINQELKENNKQTVQLLLDYGADPSAVNTEKLEELLGYSIDSTPPISEDPKIQ